MIISNEDVILRIKKFINKALKVNIDDNEDIFTLASKNSLFAFQFILFLEKTYGIEVTPEDFEKDIFSNVNTLSEFIIFKTLEGEKVGRNSI